MDSARFAFPCLALGILLVGCYESPSVAQPRCLQLPKDDSPVVAQVGTASISAAQLAERARAQGTRAVRHYADENKLRQFVEDQIRFELLVQAALERGLANDPDVVAAARKIMVRKLLQRDLGPTVFGGEIEEERIVAYYNRHKDDYRRPETRRIGHIELEPTEGGRVQAEALIKELTERADDSDLFAKLVRRHSRDSTSHVEAGELPYLEYDEMEKEFGPSFAKEVFGMAPGTLASDPVQSIKGWHVVKVVSRREALMRSLDEVREDIRSRLLKGYRAKHFDTYLAEIRQRHPVALHESRLDDVIERLVSVSKTHATTESP